MDKSNNPNGDEGNNSSSRSACHNIDTSPPPSQMAAGGWMRTFLHRGEHQGRRRLSQLAARANRKNPPTATTPQPPQPPQPRSSSNTAAGRLIGWLPLGHQNHPKMPKMSKRARRQIRRFGPILLLVSLLVYVLLGAAAFLFFEHSNHEQMVRKWFFNLIVNRHKYARQISSAIFNGTRNMLVIVDYDSSERIQRDLVQLLSQYEQQLDLRMPDLNEWTFTNSLTYCWGLLTTIGHGHRAPKTGGGQMFALFYCLLGVPFFVLTLIVLSDRLFQCCHVLLRIFTSKRRPPSLSATSSFFANHRLLLLLLLCFIYSLWLLLFAILLFSVAIPESFWRSLYTAVLASLTIQSADYNGLAEPQKLLTLGGASISLLLACLCIFSLLGLKHGRNVIEIEGRTRKLIVVNETGGTVKLTKASGANQKSASSPNSPTEKNGKGQKK